MQNEAYKIEITVCDNGYMLKSPESEVVFSEPFSIKKISNYSTALKDMINYILHSELAEASGDKDSEERLILQVVKKGEE